MTAQPRKIDAVAELTRLPLFQALTEEQIAQLAAATREKRLQRGEMLFQRGDNPRGFYLVVAGQIKLAISSPQGNEKVVEIIGPMQSFGEAVMFMGKPYPVFAQGLAESTLLHIPQEQVFELLETDALFARRMLAGLSMRLHSLVQDVESYTLRSGTERLIGYLLQQGGPQENGRLEVTLPATKQVIASLLNITPETISRIFHELSSNGLIEVQGRQISIPDVARLSRHQP